VIVTPGIATRLDVMFRFLVRNASRRTETQSLHLRVPKRVKSVEERG
jgi:hypothetical protein